MKYLYAFLLICNSLVIIAQVNTQLAQFEIIENDNGIYVEYGNPNSNYQYKNANDKDEWDTLYFELDVANLIDKSIIIVGPNYSFFHTNITWLAPEFGYILLNSEHQYTIGVRLWTYSGVYWVFNENYTIYETDKLVFKSEDAIYELEFAPVDVNNIPFSQLDGDYGSKIYVMIPQGIGFYRWQFVDFPGIQTFFSELSEDISIQCSSIFYDVETNNYACFIEFPTLNGINQNQILQNNPQDYILANINMYITDGSVDEYSIGFLTGMFYRKFNGEYVSTGSGALPFVDPIDYWNQDLYLINQDDDDFKLTVSMMAITEKAGQPYTECWEPYLENTNDSIAGFWYMFTPQNIYKAGKTDTLFFGKSPTTFWYDWYNNSPENKIFAFGGSFGMLWEYMKSLPGEASYKIKDGNGNILLEGSGCEIIEYNNPQPGYYSVEVINSSSPLSNGFGTSILNTSFYFGADDANPPKLNPVQFRDSLNQPTYIIETGEQLALYFSAKDLNDIYDTTGNSMLVYQPIINDSTKAFIKEHESSVWQQIYVEKYYEDTLAGFYYRSDLSAYTNLDSTSLDLMIVIQDFTGNKSEYIISPAVIINGSIQTNIETKLFQTNETNINIFPNPANDKIYFNLQNLRQGVDYKIKLLNANCQLIKEVNNVQSSQYTMNVADLTFGVYFYLIIENGELLQQGKVVIK